ncbi:MAG: ATP-dependent DNA helicase [Candidatus Bathyarchaeia archaeon]
MHQWFRLSHILFPYEFREFQEEFLDFIRLGVHEGKAVLADAATGFGKTPLILAALIPEALKHNVKVLWIVRTGSETDRPIEELKVLHSSRNLRFFGFSFRGKRDMCLLLRDLRLSGEVSHEEASLICRTYKDRCPYRRGFEGLRRDVLDELVEEPRLYTEILEFCGGLKVCPYLVQLMLMDYAGILALNYNYIVDPKISNFMRRRVGFRNAILVVDEAHNLQKAAEELNSDRITSGTVERAIREAELLGDRDVAGFLDALNGYFQKFHGEIEGEDALFPLEECAWKAAGGLEDFEQLCIEARRLGNRIRRQRLLEGKIPRSSLYHLGNFWIRALEGLGVDGVALTASREGEALAVEFTDMRTSELLGSLWREFRSCIFCSGTLKPLEAFAEIVGLKDYVGRVFPSPYSERNLITLITRGLSTRGEELTDDMALRYLDALEGFMASLRVNLAVFTSSYRVQRKLLDRGLRDLAEKYGRRIYVEEQGLRGDEGRKILEGFKASASDERKGMLVAVMGGRFAEGADYPGEQLEAIFIVGMPFEKPTVKTQLYIEYYQRLYGEDKGRFYAYTLPALKRASQAMGRALRSKEDRAVLVLGDWRYRRYLELLPDYVQGTAKIVAGRREPLAKEISEAKRRLFKG